MKKVFYGIRDYEHGLQAGCHVVVFERFYRKGEMRKVVIDQVKCERNDWENVEEEFLSVKEIVENKEFHVVRENGEVVIIIDFAEKEEDLYLD